MCYTLDEIRDAVSSVAIEYNSTAPADARIRGVSLFGSYAEGAADDDSDVDLLVSFSSPTVSLFTLARVLEAMEKRMAISVDLVQEPLLPSQILWSPLDVLISQDIGPQGVVSAKEACVY